MGLELHQWSSHIGIPHGVYKGPQAQAVPQTNEVGISGVEALLGLIGLLRGLNENVYIGPDTYYMPNKYFY